MRRRDRDVPGQQVVQAVHRVRADAGNDMAQVSLGLHAVERGRADQRVEKGGALASRVAAGEEPVLSSKSNLAVILPMSGRTSSSTIAGIRYTGGARVAFRASGEHRVSSCTSS